MPIANIDLQTSVRQALDWDLELDARHIATSADTGAVTLSGYVPSHRAKACAVKTAERLAGVKSVADELEVHLLTPVANNDSAVAALIVRTFESNIHLARFNLTARVANGHVTLSGIVDKIEERDEAQRAVARLHGVQYVLNDISVKPRATGGEVKSQIDAALIRHGARDASHIHVAVSGTRAVLSGHLRSLEEARIARSAASRVPGVTQVVDRFCIIR